MLTTAFPNIKDAGRKYNKTLVFLLSLIDTIIFFVKMIPFRVYL